MDERSTHHSATVDIGQIGDISHISGGFAIGGDVVAGNKTVIQNIIQQVAKKIVSQPYKFLSSYDISDRDIFFGRDALTAEIAGKIPRHKVLLINGASGSGKSSLINAGVIPLLAENGYTYVSFRDYSDPLRQLQDYLVKTAIFPTAGLEIELLTQIVQGFQRQQLQVVFIFDQFERFFVNVPLSARSQFIEMIKICMDSLQTDEMSVIFSMREEFLGQFQREFEKVMRAFVNECERFNIAPLNRDEARQAIVKPLALIQAKIVYEKSFVDDLLDGLEAEIDEKGISPPHLQIVCNQLYKAAYQQLEHEPSVIINRELYEQLGGTQTILRTYLDDRVTTVANNDLNHIELLHSLLKQMIETAGTRKFVTAQQLHDNLPDVAASQIDDFLTKLQDARVIEMRSQEASYSLSHEFMVAKVTSWLDERERARKRAEEALERGLREWNNSEALLNEKQIKQIRTAQITLNAEAEKFLRDSEAECDEQRRKKEEQIQQINSEREARQKALDSRHKIIQLGFVVTLVLSVIATGFGIVSYLSFKQANENLKKAQRNESLLLANLSRQELEKGDATRAMVLALEALPKNMDAPERPYIPQAEHSLHNAFYHPRIEHILKHEKYVNSAKFSRDGQKVVTASDDKTAKIWKVTGERIAELEHEEYVWDAKFSPDGQKVVTASYDKTAKIWKVTGERIAELEHEAKVSSAKFSQDGQKVVTASYDKTAKIWKVTGDSIAREPIATLKHGSWVYYALQHEDSTSSCSTEFSPDGQKVVTASLDKTAKLWNVTGELIAPLKHEHLVYYVKFSPDGQKVVTASLGNTAKIWKVTGDSIAREPIATLKHQKYVNSAEFSPDGQKVVTASWDNTAKIWKVTGESIATLQHQKYVNSAKFSQDGQKVVTTSLDTAKIWKVTGDSIAREPIATLKHEKYVRSAEFSPDGQKVVTASSDTAKIWKVTDEVITCLGDKNPVKKREFSPDGQKVLTISEDNTAKIWNVTGEPIATLQHDLVWNAKFSPDSQKVVTVSGDNTAKIWNVTGELIATLQHDLVWNAKFSPDGQKVVTVSEDNTAKIWKVTGDSIAREPIATPKHEEGVVNSAEFSQDGQKVVTASSDTAKIWKVTGDSIAREPIATLKHEGGVDSAKFSRDGQKVVTVHLYETAKIWKVTGDSIAREPIATPKHENGVISAEFSPDGQKVVTVSGDGTAKIWKVTGDSIAREPIATLTNEKGVISAEFSPDSQKVMTTHPSVGGEAGNEAITIWEVSSEKQLITIPTSEAVFSSDWKSLLVTLDDATCVLKKPFNTTQELINAARESIPKGFTVED